VAFYVPLSEEPQIGGLPLKRASTGIMARSTAILEAGFALDPSPFRYLLFLSVGSRVDCNLTVAAIPTLRGAGVARLRCL